MDSFEIATYSASVGVRRVGSPTLTVRDHALDLLSVQMYHGFVITAGIVFSTSFDSWTGSDVVGYYGGGDTFHPVIVGWLPLAEYSAWLDLLRSEKPVSLGYEFSATTPNYLSSLSLFTGPEPIGEGPKDTSVPLVSITNPLFGKIFGVDSSILQKVLVKKP